MRIKTIATAAAAVALAACATFGTTSAFADGGAQFDGSKLTAKEKAFLTDLSATTGNKGALKDASADQVKKVVGVFKTACQVPADKRREALGNATLKGKLDKAAQDKLAASWEKNLCKG